MLAGILAVILSASPCWAQTHVVIKPTLPSLGNDDKADDTIYCRPPMYQSDSRLLGPRTCRPQRQWDQLHAQGLDIGADGKSVVASEKYRNVQGN